MKLRKHPLRLLLFAFVLLCLLTGLTGFSAAPRQVDTAPQMQAAALSVIINEVAWAGTQASANAEWIELYNPGAVDISLVGWTLTSTTDNSPNILLTGTIVAGGYYLLERSADTTVNNISADLIYTGALTNKPGEILQLLDNTSTVIDTANQDGGDWTAGDATANPHSMERINAVTDGPSAWASNNEAVRNGVDAGGNPINGTPRQINSVTLALTSTVTATATNTATSTGTPTTTGTVTSTGTATNTATATSTSLGTGTILINEVAWAGTVADSSDEWIELRNPTTADVNITGWRLYGDNNTLNQVGTPNITLSGTIPAGGFFLLERVEEATNVTANQIYSSGDLLNSGERLYLKDSSGNTIDTANSDGGTWPAGIASPTYASMERVGTTSQWVTYGGTIPVAFDRSGNAVKGTPGSANWISTNSITTITSDSPDPSLVNQNVTVSVTVLGGNTTPTGTVAITGTNQNCTITLSNGAGSCTVKFTSLGSKTITATYTSTSGIQPSNDTESHQVSNTTATRTPTRAPTVAPQPLVAINEFVPRPGHDWNLDGEVNVEDEYIEIINHGTINVTLSGYTLDDEANIGSNPYSLPAVTIKPGERLVFYGSETGLLLSDGGDGVRLLKPNGQLMDAYNYTVARYSDQSYCRLPDNGGLDDWNQNCYPTPGLQNSLGGSVFVPANGVDLPFCPIADTLPDDFVLAECIPFGNNIWRWAFWDETGWYGEKVIPEIENRRDVFVD